MSTLALVKADFVAQLPFSTQIEEAQYRPFVQFAHTLDLLPLLGHVVLEAVDALPSAAVREYAEGIAIATGDFISRRERVYKALIDAPTLPPPVLPLDATDTSAQWAYEPLRTLWHHYLKAWWVQQSFSRFLAQHGLNITKAGITVPIDRSQGTYDRANATEKANLGAAVDTTAEALRSRLLAFVHADHQRFAATPAEGYAYAYLYGTATSCGASPSHRRVRFRAV
jgi:hypothetical protein